MTLDQITSRLREFFTDEMLLRRFDRDYDGLSDYSDWMRSKMTVLLTPVVLSLLEEETRKLRDDFDQVVANHDALSKHLTKAEAERDQLKSLAIADAAQVEQAEAETQALREALREPLEKLLDEFSFSRQINIQPTLAQWDRWRDDINTALQRLAASSATPHEKA